MPRTEEQIKTVREVEKREDFSKWVMPEWYTDKELRSDVKPVAFLATFLKKDGEYGAVRITPTGRITREVHSDRATS